MERRHWASLLAAGLLACTGLSGCQDPSSWTLRGQVRFLGLRERIDAQNAKAGTLEYSISNVGKSRISGSVFAFTFSTDREVYRGTVVDDSPISGGALIYGRVTLAYGSLDETGELADAVVDSVQFD